MGELSDTAVLMGAVERGIVPRDADPDILREDALVSCDRIAVDRPDATPTGEDWGPIDFVTVDLVVQRIGLNVYPPMTLCLAWDREGNTLYYAVDGPTPPDTGG